VRCRSGARRTPLYVGGSVLHVQGATQMRTKSTKRKHESNKVLLEMPIVYQQEFDKDLSLSTLSAGAGLGRRHSPLSMIAEGSGIAGGDATNLAGW